MLTADLAALRALLAADPHDRATRLVVADLLDEAGDEEGAARQRHVAGWTTWPEPLELTQRTRPVRRYSIFEGWNFEWHNVPGYDLGLPYQLHDVVWDHLEPLSWIRLDDGITLVKRYHTRERALAALLAAVQP